MKKRILSILLVCLAGLAACATTNQTQVDLATAEGKLLRGVTLYMAQPVVTGESDVTTPVIAHDLANFLYPYVHVLIAREDFSQEENLKIAAANDCRYMGVVQVNRWKESDGMMSSGYDIDVSVTFYEVETGTLIGATSVHDTCTSTIRTEAVTGIKCIEGSLREWAQRLFRAPE